MTDCYGLPPPLGRRAPVAAAQSGVLDPRDHDVVLLAAFHNLLGNVNEARAQIH